MPSGLLRPGAAVDSPRLDSERIEEIMDGSDHWLMYASVKGYEPEDFDFLEASEKEQLAIGVEQFRDVSVKARNGGVVNEDERSRAKSGFRRILEVVRPDKYADIDAFVLGKKIENQVRDEMPDWVRELVFETGYDASGAQALWIWVEVEDDVARRVAFHDEFLLVREALVRAAGQICPDRWPYIRMRTVSEQRPKVSSTRR